jgi:hypothetical protein
VNPVAKKTAEAEQPTIVRWTVNVKYRGKRYKAGEKAEIQPEDREALVADGLIRVDEQ